MQVQGGRAVEGNVSARDKKEHAFRKTVMLVIVVPIGGDVPGALQVNAIVEAVDAFLELQGSCRVDITDGVNHLALMAAAGVGESIHAGIDLGAAIAWAGRGRVDGATFIAGISNHADAIICIYRGAAVLSERIWKLTVGVDQDS